MLRRTGNDFLKINLGIIHLNFDETDGRDPAAGQPTSDSTGQLFPTNGLP